MRLAGCATTQQGVCTSYNQQGGDLAEQEFYAALFEEWDTNDNERLSDDEVLEGFEEEPFVAWGRSFEIWFEKSGRDEGPGLTRAEFASAWESLDAFGEWDQDGDDTLSDIECDNVGAPIGGESAGIEI